MLGKEHSLWPLLVHMFPDECEEVRYRAELEVCNDIEGFATLTEEEQGQHQVPCSGELLV